MSTSLGHGLRFAALSLFAYVTAHSASLPLGAGAAEAAPPDDDDEPAVADPYVAPSAAPAPKMRVYEFAGDMMSGDMMAPESIGVTPGGAQDISYARDRIKAGEIPHAKVFTPEGLFSEHDLPLDHPMHTRKKCGQVICVDGEAVHATLIAQPEVRYLAQLGFRSNIAADTFQREPLNLVAVVDTSGSMSGEPHRLVQESLSSVVDQLGPKDQLSIVLYDSVAHVALPPTPIRKTAAIRQGIRMIQSGGSTAMEAGLQLGFDVATKSAKSFAGNTRVMLFTDERPNVGRTDKGSFMVMARSASKQGIGLTTIGVSTHFGAELAQAISSVRGGNLFFFPNVGDMQDTFEEEFDTMVTELAFDMHLTVAPQPGMKIAGVYGIPGEALKWTGKGAIELGVETLFASTKKGAIYVAFAPDGDGHLPVVQANSSVPLGDVSVRFEGRDGKKYADRADFELVPRDQASTGLARGLLLVDQSTAMKQAATFHHESNDQEAAYRTIRALATRYRRDHDPELAQERETVFALESTLAEASGHRGEDASAASSRDEVSGLPPRGPISAR